MQLSELIFVTNYVEKEIKGLNLPNLYQQVINLFNQIKQNQNVGTQLDEKKNDLINGLLSLQPRNWNVIKLKIFNKFGAGELVGKTAIARINQLLEKNFANPQGAVQDLTQMLNETNQMISRATQLKTGLGPLSDVEDEVEIEEGMTMLQLVFEGDASIGTMKELEDNSKEWRRVFLAFARLVDESPEEPEIVTIEKGSIIIDILATVYVARAISKGAVEVLGVIEKVMDIRKKALEIKQMKLANKKIEQDLEKEAQKLIDTAVEDGTKNLVKEFRGKKKKDQEIETGIKQSLKTIFSFIENGGKLELYEDDEEAEDSEVHNEIAHELSTSFEKVRELESKIEELKLLPDLNENEDKDEE